jgi:hypothetical protein
MKRLGGLLLILHGVAHLVGFRAAFWPDVGQSGSVQLLGRLVFVGDFAAGAFGVVWLVVALAYWTAGILLLQREPRWLAIALLASGVSLVMCGLAWPDARIGVLIDALLVTALLLISRSNALHLEKAFRAELRNASLPVDLSPPVTIDEQAISALPEAVKRYLRFMGVVGRPRDWSMRARFEARFRRTPGEWVDCEALQYDSRLKLSRIFYMQLALKKVLPVTVRDTYLAGRGRMRAKAFDLVDVVDGQGPELDAGELVTYLNDAILMAPSLLLGPETRWQEVDEQSFDVTLSDGPLHVTARVWLDDNGAPRDFSTTDRFFDQADGKRVRAEWRTPVSGWQDVDGRKLPTRAEAVWNLKSGPFSYADFRVDPRMIAFNVPPR